MTDVMLIKKENLEKLAKEIRDVYNTEEKYSIDEMISKIKGLKYYFANELAKTVIIEGIKYELDADGNYICTGLADISTTDVNIVDSIGQNNIFKVTKLAEKAFNSTGIKTATVSGNIILDGTTTRHFGWSKFLNRVVLEEGFTRISTMMFDGCIALTSIKLPTTLTRIDDCAFKGSGVKNLVIPNNVSFIDRSAFATKSLKRIYIGSGMQGVETEAFALNASNTCEGLTKIYLPWSKETEINFKNPSYNYNDELICYDCILDENGLVYAPSGDGYICVLCDERVPDVVIAEKINGKPVKGIGADAFLNCKSLVSITVPSSVETIGTYAFTGCDNLTDIYIDSPKNQISGANWGAPNTTTIHYLSSLSYTLSDDGTYYICSGIGSIEDTNIVIKSTHRGLPVKEIGEYAFTDTAITSVVIPSSVVTINTAAFMYCYSLTSIIIPDSVKNIESSAFYNCQYLNNIILGKGLQTIGASAFRAAQCKKIIIPSNVINIGENAFNNSHIEEIYVEKFENQISGAPWGATDALVTYKYLTEVTTEDGLVYRVNDDFSTFSLAKNTNKSIENAIVASTIYEFPVTVIDAVVFQYSDNLKTVTVPNSVITIGYRAFAVCPLLASVSLGSNIENIEEGAFLSCPTLDNITIPNKVTVLNKDLFTRCTSLKNITLPEGLIEMRDSVFYKCESLESIVIPDTVQSFEKDIFNGCVKLKNINIPDQITIIAKGMFYQCQALQSITIPNGVTSIENGAFYQCPFINITLPNGLLSIADSAFMSCHNLESISIPNSVNIIGDTAFFDCISLKYVIIDCNLVGSQLASIGQQAFYGCSSLIYIDIPYTTTTIGQMTFKNCTNLRSITIYRRIAETVMDREPWGAPDSTSIVYQYLDPTP